MSWAIGYDEHWKRDIGYGVPAVCDHPDCNTRIDRGLSYVCGSEPYGGERGCGLYFCEKHRHWPERLRYDLCERCYPRRRVPFKAKPDIKLWIDWKETDPSWAAWREERHAAATA